MLPKPESACFVIADISGYTSFLAGVELDHAQDIIADVMDTVVRRLRPPFRLAKFEGDAAFFYAVADKVDGSLLQDAIESAYFAFRKRLRNIKQATSCECSACSQMQDLDLKFVSHHGEFIKHKMAGREELAGRDVILIHRLLKNAVNERLGGHAYALYSDACIQAMGIDPAAQGLVEHRESIDIIGDVTCWVRDLEEAWEQENDRQRNEVTRDGRGSRDRVRHRRPAPDGVGAFHPARACGRNGGRPTRCARLSQSGRRGVGTTNHCMHGAHAIIEEVLDWRPFDYLTISTLLPMPEAPKVIMTYAFLEEKPGGGRISRSGWPGRGRRTRRSSSRSARNSRRPSRPKSKSSGRCWKDRTGPRPRSKSRCCRCRRSAS